MDPNAQWIEAALWSALWQSSAWLLAGLAAAGALRRHPARAHGVLLSCLVAAAVTPILSAAVRLAGWGVLPGLNRAVDVADLAARLTGEDGPPPQAWALRWPHVLAAVWLSISAVAALRLADAARRGRRLIAGAQPARSPALRTLARRVAERLGLPRPPQVLESPAVRCPVIWCWGRRPRLLLPAGEHGGGDYYGILCHELAHAGRRDHLATLAGRLALAVLPWHPLAWIAERRLGDLGEDACDRWAIASGASPAAYAESLLRLVPGARLLLAPAAAGGRSSLARRIRRILDPDGCDPQAGSRWLGAVTMLAVLVMAGAALAQRRPPTIEVVDEKAAIVPLDAPDVITIPGELDLGEGRPNEAKAREILLCNRGRETHEVLGFSTSCGCTTVDRFEPAALDPGDCMKIRITMTAPPKPGERKTRYVTFNVEGQPPLKLAVHLQAAGPES